jgi:hypothetical protein
MVQDKYCRPPVGTRHDDSPFRVRSIATAPGSTNGVPPKAFAVTAGCCYADPTTGRWDPTINGPRVMVLKDGSWNVEEPNKQGYPVDPPNLSYAPRARMLPDSLYGVAYRGAGMEAGTGCVALLASPGGPPAGQDAGSGGAVPNGDPTSGVGVIGEPVSRVIRRCPGSAGQGLVAGGRSADVGLATEVTEDYPELGSVWLAAADADLAAHKANFLDKAAPGTDASLGNGGTVGSTDALFDWAVGQLRGSGAARGVVFSSMARAYGLDAPFPLDCPSDGVASARCTPAGADATAKQVGSGHVMSLPSYALNAMAAVQTSGISWAAGDRGALLRVGDAGTASASGAGSEAAAKLGSGEATRLSSREAYDAFRPLSSDAAGLVPALSAQPTVQVPAGTLEAWGTPNSRMADGKESVREFAMSRDGSEGWAVGANPRAGAGPASTLYHFDGSRWSRCDAVGVPGSLGADAACAGLRELVLAHAQFVAVARVPLENGSDRSRANDFEAVAIARPQGGSLTVVRYRDGRWSVEREWSRQLHAISGGGGLEIAFASPEDGWVVNNGELRVGSAQVFHLVDGGWVDCEGSATGNAFHKAQCADAGGVLAGAVKAGAPDIGIPRGLRLLAVGSRVYVYGTVVAVPTCDVAGGVSVPNCQANEFYTSNVRSSPQFPVILHLDGDKGRWEAEYDPMHSDASRVGALTALSVVRGADGGFTGWGLGRFGQGQQAGQTRVTKDGETPLLQHTDGGGWGPVAPAEVGAAALEYLLPASVTQYTSPDPHGAIVALGPDGGSAVAVRDTSGETPHQPVVWRNPASGRWEALGTPFVAKRQGAGVEHQALVQAMAADGRGGAWLAATPRYGNPGNYFYRLGARVRGRVFSDVAHPVREAVTSSAGGGDGSFWVATESGTVYRHDRLTGWDRVALKGWDAGGVVASPVNAIAVGADGEGVAVGSNGRIAVVGARSVALDRAAVLCSAGTGCATTHTLRAASVAPDGSAMAGGDGRALVWRPAGGTFQAIRPPEVAASTSVAGVSLPTPERAWVVTSRGEVIAGTLAGGEWSWAREALDGDGNSLALDRYGDPLGLRSVAIDKDGHGFVVGEGGLILQRSSAGQWKRVGGYADDLRTVTLGPGGRGALIGGNGGLILTLVGGRFEVARAADYFDPLITSVGPQWMGEIMGVALLAGSKPGQVEAWAATQLRDVSGRTPAPGAVLHYSSDPQDPLLNVDVGRAQALPDAPKSQQGELVLAAFGKSECRGSACGEMLGSALGNDVVARRVRDALLGGGRQPDVALFTGDAGEVGGSAEHDNASLPDAASVMHERWWESIGAPFGRAGVPLFGALGGQDLSRTAACEPLAKNTCAGSRETQQRVGLSVPWRRALAGAPAPWGSGEARSHSGLSFAEVAGGVASGGQSTDAAGLGGARTHYAVDVSRGGQRLMRLVVLDTSLRTVSGVAGTQNPVRDQLVWLNDMLSPGTGRDSSLPAVVVSETPSYSYENSAGATTDTLLDSAAFETVLVKNHVNAVVSGRLGWNGLYWLVAPGLHTPCPGGDYRPDPPPLNDPSQLCQASGDSPIGAGDRLADQLNGTLGSAPVAKPSAVPDVPRPSKVLQDVAGGQLASIPVVVAASAGGRFGPRGEGSGPASRGFWRGYTRIRLMPADESGRRAVAIEQRPVFDWIGIQASEHTLAPGRHVDLKGYGREPIGIDAPAQYDDIDGPAITHRYDLVLADPNKPYLPKVDPTNAEENHYVPVPAELGASIDRQTGTVTYSGRGNHPPVYALAILSVGGQVATWPLVLAPRRSFAPPPPPKGLRIAIPPPPRPLGTVPAALPPTPNTPIPTPPNLNLTFPPAPGLPNLNLNMPQTTPPPPPPPPPPPVSPAASALQITPAPVGLNVAPAATVIPPPAPPIQPAPPGGARREARQRQAAAAKSEEGADQSASQETTNNNGGDGANAATRRDPPRDLAFTAHTERHQASAWTRDLLYAGGLGLGALTLALGFSLLRPGPRRRQPTLPAPAYNPTRRH